jgi:hypothetical protein
MNGGIISGCNGDAGAGLPGAGEFVTGGVEFTTGGLGWLFLSVFGLIGWAGVSFAITNAGLLFSFTTCSPCVNAGDATCVFERRVLYIPSAPWITPPSRRSAKPKKLVRYVGRSLAASLLSFILSASLKNN